MPVELHYRFLEFSCTGKSCGIALPDCTPFDYLAALPLSENQQLPVWPQASELFFKEILHRSDINASFRIHLLQLGIFLFQFLELRYITGFHAAVLGFPVVKSCLADPNLTTNVFDSNASFLFLDRGYNLILGKTFFYDFKN